MSKDTVILINPRKSIKDAFINSDVHLYLPVDDKGNVVDPSKARRLECWVSVSAIAQAALPEVFGDDKAGISNALLWKKGDHEFGTLSRSVAFGSIMKLNEWLHTLHRLPARDISYSKAYIANQ